MRALSYDFGALKSLLANINRLHVRHCQLLVSMTNKVTWRLQRDDEMAWGTRLYAIYAHTGSSRVVRFILGQRKREIINKIN